MAGGINMSDKIIKQNGHINQDDEQHGMGMLYQVKQAEGRTLTYSRDSKGNVNQLDTPKYETLSIVVAGLLDQLDQYGFYGALAVLVKTYNDATDKTPRLDQIEIDVSGTQTLKYLVSYVLHVINRPDSIDKIPASEWAEMEYFVYERNNEDYYSEFNENMSKMYRIAKRETYTVETRIAEGFIYDVEVHINLLNGIRTLLEQHLTEEYQQLYRTDYETHIKASQYRDTESYQATSAVDKVIDKYLDINTLGDVITKLKRELRYEYLTYHSNADNRFNEIEEITGD